MFNKYSQPDAVKDVFQAVQDNDLANLRFFLSDGADTDLRNDAGLTLLHAAINAGKTDVARLLLDAGADPDLHGGGAAYTALHFTAYKQNAEMTKLVLEYHPKLESTDNSFFTPLQTAAFMGAPDVARVLAEAGADVTRKDAFGHTPAHIAQQRAGENWDQESKRFIDTSVYLQSVERNGTAPQQEQKQHDRVAEDLAALRRHNPQRYKLKPPGR